MNAADIRTPDNSFDPSDRDPFAIIPGVPDDFAGFTPLNGYIVCRRLPDQPMPGGLVVPKTEDDRRAEVTRAVVLRVGPGRIDPKRGRRLAPSVAVGDIVLLPKFIGHDVRPGSRAGTPAVIVDERSILTVCGPVAPAA